MLETDSTESHPEEIINKPAKAVMAAQERKPGAGPRIFLSFGDGAETLESPQQPASSRQSPIEDTERALRATKSCKGSLASPTKSTLMRGKFLLMFRKGPL
jgi:hypothetical protein